MNKINVAYLAWMLASWKQVKEGFKDFYDDQLDKLCDLLPTGSGIDAGIKLDRKNSYADRIVFTFEYHHMEDGSYAGWTEHSLVIKPDLQHGYKLHITGKDRGMVKEYLYDLFGESFYHNVQDSKEKFDEEAKEFRKHHELNFPR